VKRLTFAAVDQAYRATGLTPKAGLWFRPKHWVDPNDETGNVKENIWRRGKKIQGVACPLGAVAVYKSYTREIADTDFPDDAFEADALAPYLGLDVQYVDGFTWGFDHKSADPEPCDTLSGDKDPPDAYRQGIRDGRAIRMALGTRVKRAKRAS